MLKKIFKFAKGYVIIEVRGRNKERFVSECVCAGAEVFDAVPSENGLRLGMVTADFMKIRPIARKCRVSVRIILRRGIRELFCRYRHRYAFFVMSAAACIFFAVVPHYIWCVEIDGTYYADKNEIMEILRGHGVYTGAKKSGIDDLGEIKNAVVFGVDEINWAWLYIEGARARLQVQEKSFAPDISDTVTPTDIIASHDGVIVSADVMRGERRVNAGMTVCAGDTLVSGKVAVFREGYPEKYIYVNSDAKITADTIRRESGVFSAEETLRIRTSNAKKRFSPELFGKRIDLFRDGSGGFEDYDTVSKRYDWDLPFWGYTGLSVTVHDIYEVRETSHELTEREVLMRAKEQLEEKICRSLPAGAVKTDEELTYNVVGGNYEVTLQMHLRENIGIEIPAKE